MTGRRLRCSAPGLWDNLSRSTAGLGSSPTSIFAGPAPCKNFGVWPHPNCLPFRALPLHGAKKRRSRFLTLPPFLSPLSSLGSWLQRFSVPFRPERLAWHRSAFCTRSLCFWTGKSIDLPIYRTL